MINYSSSKTNIVLILRINHGTQIEIWDSKMGISNMVDAMKDCQIRDKDRVLYGRRRRTKLVVYRTLVDRNCGKMSVTHGNLNLNAT